MLLENKLVVNLNNFTYPTNDDFYSKNFKTLQTPANTILEMSTQKTHDNNKNKQAKHSSHVHTNPNQSSNSSNNNKVILYPKKSFKFPVKIASSYEIYPDLSLEDKLDSSSHNKIQPSKFILPSSFLNLKKA